MLRFNHTHMPKHFFFDLDNTLTPTKSTIRPEHVPLFKKLCESFDVIVASGHGADVIREHLGEDVAGLYFTLGQNGNQAILKDQSVLWEHVLSPEQKDAVQEFTNHIRAIQTEPVQNENDLIEDRGSQIAYSVTGHHEKLEKKVAYDPDGSKRKLLLAQLNAERKKLDEVGVEVIVGGSTCLDFYMRGMHKGYNVAKFIERMDWKKEESVYIGDAFEPGRNDATVVGVIPTRAVSGPDETFLFVKEMLS